MTDGSASPDTPAIGSVVVIERATIADAAEILALIKRAFAPVAEQYESPELPPLTETLGSFRARFRDHIVLKAVEHGRIVGTIQGVARDDTCFVERLAVDPACQGRGIGRALARRIEELFPHVARFELFTGHASAETLSLYHSLGYREIRRERVSPRLSLVYLEKPRPCHRAAGSPTRGQPR